MNWIVVIKICLFTLSLNLQSSERFVRSNSFGCLKVIGLSNLFNSFMRVNSVSHFVNKPLNVFGQVFGCLENHYMSQVL